MDKITAGRVAGANERTKMKEKTVYTLSGIPSVVQFGDGTRMPTKRAIAEGYKVFEFGTNRELSGEQPNTQTYAEKLAALPEAKARPAAAARLAELSTEKTMPLERAASMLRGLPEEKLAATPKVVQSNVRTAADTAVVRRKTEIRVAALSQSAANGSHAAADEARKLRYALDIQSQTGCRMGDAFNSVGLNGTETLRSILGL